MIWLPKRQTVKPSIAMRRRIDFGPSPPRYPIYAIGDVHGCIDELLSAETRIADDIKATGRQGLVVLLGDYVDRGPNSRGVLDHLIQPSGLGLKRLPLCGNHDALFASFIEQPGSHANWLELGGEQTLFSYGINLHSLASRYNERIKQFATLMRDVIPETHRKFLAALPVCLKIGSLLFVHAGVRPNIPFEKQSDEDMLWIREPFISEGPATPFLVVHGHTPKTSIDVGPSRIGIDTGAYFTGKLTVLKIEGGRALLL